MSLERIIAAIPGATDAQRAQQRANVGEKLLSGSPKEQEEARAVLDALDAYERTARQELSKKVANMSERDRVHEAYRVVPPTDTDAKVIRALLQNPGGTSEELTSACGWQGQAWHLHFGLMCFRREIFLWPAEHVVKRDARFYTGILADYDEATHGFTMKHEAAEAFSAIGFGGRP